MIELSQTSITIDAPTPVIFKYVSNMENYKRWFPGVVDIKSANNLEHGVIGKKYVEKLSLPSGESELIIEVNQCDTNHLFITKGDLAGILPHGCMAIKSCRLNSHRKSACMQRVFDSYYRATT